MPFIFVTDLKYLVQIDNEKKIKKYGSALLDVFVAWHDYTIVLNYLTNYVSPIYESWSLKQSFNKIFTVVDQKSNLRSKVHSLSLSLSLSTYLSVFIISLSLSLVLNQSSKLLSMGQTLNFVNIWFYGMLIWIATWSVFSLFSLLNNCQYCPLSFYRFI